MKTGGTNDGWRLNERLKDRTNNYRLCFINIHANIAINSREVARGRDRYVLYIVPGRAPDSILCKYLAINVFFMTHASNLFRN